jgi:hypothetical protein
LPNKHEHLDPVGVIAVPFCPTIPRASRSAPPSSMMSACTSSPKRAMRADVWEDKIHDIPLDKSRVTVGEVAIDGLGFETPAPPCSWIYHLKFTT